MDLRMTLIHSKGKGESLQTKSSGDQRAALIRLEELAKEVEELEGIQTKYTELAFSARKIEGERDGVREALKDVTSVLATVCRGNRGSE